MVSPPFSELMRQFLNMILRGSLERRRDFEAGQAYLGLFMKKHGESIIQPGGDTGELGDTLEKVLRETENSWGDLKSDLSSSSTIVAFFKNPLLCWWNVIR